MGDARKSLGWMVLLVAVLALGGGAWWLLRGEGERAEAPGGVITKGPLPAPEKPEIVVPATPERHPAPPPPPEVPRVGAVAGRVVTPDRRVLAGAHVQAWRGATSAIPGLLAPKKLEFSAVADEAGHF